MSTDPNLSAACPSAVLLVPLATARWAASAPRGTQLTTHIVANVDFVELVVPLDVRSGWQPGTALMWNT
jgi:hypothetical protein